MRIKNLMLAIAVATVAPAAQAETATEIEDLPACYSIQGEPVFVEFADGLGRLALASRSEGRPVIKIDADILKKSSWEWTVFSIAHECGHHTLGHLDPHSASFGIDRKRELEADCHAGTTMALQQLGNSEVRSVGSDLARNPPEAPAMVPGTARAAKLMSCYDAARGFPRND